MSEQLIIEQIEIYKARIKLKKPFVISLGRFDFSENVIIRMYTNMGIIGYGECSPFKTINGESIETCFIVGQFLAKALIGKNAYELDYCIGLMDKLIYANSSIKSAFDMALYDINSKYRSLPLYAYLGGTNKSITTDYTVSIGDADTMAADALQVMKQGYPVIKIKLGEQIDIDLNRIVKIRNSIGMEIPLRIDANQGWNVTSAIEILNQLKDFNVQFCEEPIPRWDFMNLSEISNNSPVPIMADESCCNDHDAERLIALNACKLFNVKLGKAGGIRTAVNIAQKAVHADIKLQVGGFLESRLGFTASAHFALSSPQVLYYDFDTPLMFEEDYILGGMIYDANGKITINDHPGLGITVDERFLKNCIRMVIKN